MANSIIYMNSDYISSDFPFKLEVKRNNNVTRSFHAHEALQINYITKGTCLHNIFGKNSIAVKGNIFFTPPFVEHKIDFIDSNDFELIQIDFLPSFINENMNELSQMQSFVDFAYIRPLIVIEENASSKLNLSAKSQLIIEQLISNIRSELEKMDEGYKLAIKADLLKFLVIIGREYKHFVKDNDEKQLIVAYRKSFNKVMEYISEKYYMQITLQDASAIVNVSPTYFSHLFKLVNGKTFIEYLNGIRIRKAMDLVAHSEMNITEVSYAVGFNNLSHFDRMFRKSTGVSPTAYKNSTNNS